MKLLILSLFVCAGIGAGAYGLRTDTDEVRAGCLPSECRVTVECTGEATCLVTCLDEDGEVLCQQEVECDEPCDAPCASACEAPCEAPSAASER